MSKIIPFHDRDGVLWWNGSFVDWRDAKISILTHGLHYGSAVFEGERAYRGRVFASRAHSERLRDSALMLGMELPVAVDELERVKVEVLERAGLEDGYLRPIVWRGSEALAVSALENSIQIAVACWEWPSYFGDKMGGIRLAMADWRRPPAECAPVKAKAAGLYMICTLSKHQAAAQGYDDALMLDYRGRVAECTGAHIFFVRDGELHTPTGDILLDGITRASVMDLARARGITVHARDILPEEMETFSEVFIVGTAAEITPVREIEGRRYTPGDLTRTIVEDYARLVTGELVLEPA